MQTYHTNSSKTREWFDLSKPTRQTKAIKARLHFEIVCNKKFEVHVTLFLGLIFSQDFTKNTCKAYRWEAHKRKERQQLIFLQAT